MDKNDFGQLMDQVIVRELLPGNSASTPKKKVRIMVCADFEDSCDPQEKFYHWTPVHIDDLPPFRLCHADYWKPEVQNKALFKNNDEHAKPQVVEIREAELQLGRLAQ